MRRSNCSAPNPPGHPRDITFFCYPGVLITLFLPCPALYKHSNHSFFQCPAHFLSHKFFLWPRGCPGGDGGRTIWPAHYINSRKSIFAKSKLLQENSLFIVREIIRFAIILKSCFKSCSPLKEFEQDTTIIPFRAIIVVTWRHYDFKISSLRRRQISK